MKQRSIAVFITIGLVSLSAAAQNSPPPAPDGGQSRSEVAGGREPPPKAYEDCRGKRAGDTVQHTTREGAIGATCVDSPKGLVARPGQERGGDPHVGQRGNEPRGTDAQAPGGRNGNAGTRKYSLEQAVSDRAQLHTIAFDGLAFLTGDFAADTFLPPGKVSDYFGFQYMRDIDAGSTGHNTSFLTRIASNTLTIMNDEQRARFLALAKAQDADVRRFAEMRFPLIQAFRRNLEGKLPAGSKGLDRAAVMKYSAELYELDGVIAWQRAEAMGAVIRSFSEAQRAALAKLKFGDSRTWPDVPEPMDKRSMPHSINVAMMTYASEMFAWYAGNLEADTYFCPERHGMYFGGFGMKTAPAMGKQDYSISTALTGDAGEDFLNTLNPAQRKLMSDIIEAQRKDLAEIVQIRRSIATELRRFQQGGQADKARVLAWSRRYGELDGEMAWLYAKAFGEIGRSLSAEQKARLAKLRDNNPNDPKGPFLYSDVINMPAVANTDYLFGGH